MSLKATVSEICRGIASACLGLIEKIEIGCDDKTFLALFQQATTELQNLVKFVQAYDTTFAREKKELLTSTLAVKNAVIKTVTELRAMHKQFAGSPVIDSTPLRSLQSELTTALAALGRSAQRLAQVELEGATDDGSAAPPPTETPHLPHAGTGTTQLVRSPSSSTQDASSDPPSSPRGHHGAAAEEKPIVALAKKALIHLADMSTAIEQREKDFFTESTKTAIALVNQLVAQSGGLVSDQQRQDLRQNLIAFVSHAKMHFINPEDIFTRTNYDVLRSRVEGLINLFLDNAEQGIVFAPGVETPPGSSTSELSPRQTSASAGDPLSSPRGAAARRFNLTETRRSDDMGVMSSGPPTVRNPPSSSPNIIQPTSPRLSFKPVHPEESRLRNSEGDDEEEEDEDSPLPDQSQLTTAPPRLQTRSTSSSSLTAKPLPEPLPPPSDTVRPPPPPMGTPLIVPVQKARRAVSTSNTIAAVEAARNMLKASEPKDAIPEEEEMRQGHDERTAVVPKPLPTPAQTDAALTDDPHETQFLRSVMDLVKRSFPTEWIRMHHPDQIAFEKSILQCLAAYNQEKRTAQGPSSPRLPPLMTTAIITTPPPTAIATSPLSGKKMDRSVSYAGQTLTTSSGSPVSPRAALPSAEDKKKKLKLGKMDRSTSMSTLSRKGTTKKRKDPGIPLFRYLDPPNDSSTPSRLSKNFCEEAVGYMGEIFKFVEEYNDTDPAYILKLSSKFGDLTDHPIRRMLGIHLKQLFTYVKEAFEFAILSGFDSSEAMSKVQSRLAKDLTGPRAGTVVKLDTKLLSQGQYLRYVRSALFTATFYKAEQIFTLVSQMATALRAYDTNDKSSVYHLLSLCSVMNSSLIEAINDIESFYWVVQEQEKFMKGVDKLKLEKRPKTENIWNEPPEPTSLSKDDIYRPGSLNALVMRLTNSTFNGDLLGAFLAGYELFSSPAEVWDKLDERFTVPKNASESDQAQFVKMRVANVILQWVRNDLHAIDFPVLQMLETFAEKTLKKEKFEELSSMILKELKSKERFNLAVTSDQPRKVPVFGLLSGLTPYGFLMDGEKETIAEQLALIESELYQRIGRTELINGKWSKEKLSVLSRNVIRMITRVNEVAYFVATHILLQRKVKDRAKLLIRMIGIAVCLYEMRNFSSLMGVLTGLSLSPISRLKHTWAKVPAKNLELFQELQLIQDPSNSFRNLREQLEEAGMQSLPYIGTFLSDLTFMDEGNPDTVEIEGRTLINLTKYSLVLRTIKQIQNYQGVSFDVAPREPFYSLLKELPKLEEKELHELSLSREPRNALPKDIE